MKKKNSKKYFKKSGISAACTDGSKYFSSLTSKIIKKKRTKISSQQFVNFVKKISKQ